MYIIYTVYYGGDIYIYIYPKADPNNMGLYSMGIAIRWDISQI
jgi:hypothetical protein